jgi:hypothetical protein
MTRPKAAKSTKVKYPHIRVELGNLAGPEGNAFVILRRVSGAMAEVGLSKEEVEEYTAEAQSGDYDNLLSVTGRWVTVL